MSFTISMSRLVLAGITTGLVACSHDNLVLPDEGKAAKITIVSGDAQSGEAGSALPDELVVLVTDGLNRPVVGQAVSFTPANGTSGQVSEVTVATDASGHAATQWTLGPGVGGQQARAGVIANGAVVSTMTVTFGATATAGAAARLAFSVQPSSTVAGAAVTPAVEVEVQDQHGNRVTTATTSITLALANNAASATLSGGGTVNAVEGVATFANVSLNHTGTGYTLAATASGGIAPATSSAFDVGSGVPHHLDFTVPASARAGSAITPTQVTVRDALNNVVTSPSLSITVSIQNSPAGGTLSGTKTVATVNGVATFTNLTIDRAGNGYTLHASSGGLDVQSNAVNVLAGNVNGLDFVASPSGSVTGAPLGTVQVRVLDAQGNLVTTATNSITVNSSVAGTLTGTNMASAVNGIATFSNLTINKVGDYRLVAHASGLVDATSNLFTVAKASTTITITTPAGSSTLGQPFTVSYDINIVSPGAGSLTGSVEVTDGVNRCVGGITAGSGIGSCPDTFFTAGSRTLTARYLGDQNFVGSTSPGVSHTVNKAPTTTTATSDSPDPSTVETPFTVTWTVSVPSGAPAPTGNVTVSMAHNDSTCVAPVGAGTCDLTPTVALTDTITVSYSGDANYNGSSGTRVHVVGKATTTTSITSVSPSSSFLLGDVAVAFSVSSNTVSTLGDSVKIKVNNVVRCTAAVSAGSCTVPGTVFALPGTYSIVANYQGDANHSASSSAAQNHVVSILNTAPTANDDNVAVNEDATLSVSAANGVLHNDTDGQNDPLTDTLVSGPSHAASFTLNADGSFSYTPAANFYGSDSFTYYASDGQLRSNTATVTITVNPVNDAPSFTKGADVSMSATTDPQSVPGWATNLSPGPANESGQSLAFQIVDVTSNNGSLFAPGGDPAIDANGNLTFTPSGAEGTATVTVRLTDDGGTANGGQDASPTTTFTITFTPVAP